MLKKSQPGQEEANARKLQRYRVESACQVETASGTFTGLLTNLSPIGARIETDASVETDEQVTIKRPDASTVTGHVVRAEEGAIDLKFEMNAESVSYAFKTLTEPMLNAGKSQSVDDETASNEESETEIEPDEAPQANEPAEKEGLD